MRYGFYRRLFEVEILLLIVALQFLIAYLLLTYLPSSAYFLLFKALVVGACIAFLINSQLFGFLQSKFPALKRYVIRSILVGCLFLMFTSWDVLPSSDVLKYFLIGNLVIGCLLIGVAKIAALLGI